jgi:hypothetical protein
MNRIDRAFPPTTVAAPRPYLQRDGGQGEAGSLRSGGKLSIPHGSLAFAAIVQDFDPI